MTLPIAVGRAFYGQRSALREAQERAIDPIMSGSDALVIAGTGSGKTEAVVAPIIGRHLEELGRIAGVGVIYLSPTKALANDMLARLEGPLNELRLTVGARHGDRNDLHRKLTPQVLITTPESLDIEIVFGNEKISPTLAVIIDEVHQLTGTQRGRQVALLLERFERWQQRPLQVAGMSATLVDPDAAWEFLRPGRPCAVIAVSNDRSRHYVLRRETADMDLVSLLSRTSSHGKVLTFAGSRRRTEEIASMIGSNSPFGERVFTHHSALSKEIREQVERSLHDADATLCLATNTLELGIDIGDIRLVVLVGTPFDWRSIEQRIGRTNRRGDSIEAICVVPPESRRPVFDTAYFLGLISQLQQTIPRAEARDEVWGAVAQQLTSAVRSAKGWLPVAEVTALLTTIPEVAAEDVELLIAHLVELDVLVRHPVADRIGPGEALHDLEASGDAWGNFPASAATIKLYQDTRLLGEVPASRSNRSLLQVGRTVGFRGTSMVVERVTRPFEVRLRPQAGKPAGQLQFGGIVPAADPRLVHAMPTLLATPLADSVMSATTKEWWRRASEHMREVIAQGAITTWRGQAGVSYATFAGQWINSVLQSSVAVEGNAFEIGFTSLRPIDFTALPPFDDMVRVAATTSPMVGNPTTWQELLPPALAIREAGSAWLRDPFYRQTWNSLRAGVLLQAPDDRLIALR